MDIGDAKLSKKNYTSCSENSPFKWIDILFSYFTYPRFHSKWSDFYLCFCNTSSSVVITGLRVMTPYWIFHFKFSNSDSKCESSETRKFGCKFFAESVGFGYHFEKINCHILFAILNFQNSTNKLNQRAEKQSNTDFETDWFINSEIIRCKKFKFWSSS